MADLEDVPVVGRVVAVTAPVMDLALNSGEFVFLVIEFLVTNVGLLTAILRTLESLAQRIPILPVGIFDDILIAVLIAFLVVEVGKLGSRALEALA